LIGKSIVTINISAIILAKEKFPNDLFKIESRIHTAAYKVIVDTEASKEGRRIIKHGLAIHMPRVR
jgi:hypothetical protein